MAWPQSPPSASRRSAPPAAPSWPPGSALLRLPDTPGTSSSSAPRGLAPRCASSPRACSAGRAGAGARTHLPAGQADQPALRLARLVAALAFISAGLGGGRVAGVPGAVSGGREEPPPCAPDQGGPRAQPGRLCDRRKQRPRPLTQQDGRMRGSPPTSLGPSPLRTVTGAGFPGAVVHSGHEPGLRGPFLPRTHRPPSGLPAAPSETSLAPLPVPPAETPGACHQPGRLLALLTCAPRPPVPITWTSRPLPARFPNTLPASRRCLANPGVGGFGSRPSSLRPTRGPHAKCCSPFPTQARPEGGPRICHLRECGAGPASQGRCTAVGHPRSP